MTDYSHLRIPYLIIYNTEPEYTWSFSAEELEKHLDNLLSGRNLKKVCANLPGYLEGSKRNQNVYDFTYMGGPVMMIFSDNTALEFDILAEGLISYRIHTVSDLYIRQVMDFPPEHPMSEEYLYDLKEVFDLEYENEIIEKVQVDITDTYPFSDTESFDEKKLISQYSVAICQPLSTSV